jgi:hypothetical protein
MLLLFLFSYKHPSLLYLEIALDFGGGEKDLKVLLLVSLSWRRLCIRSKSPLSWHNYVYKGVITNLTFHDLVMKIMQILFIDNLYISCTDIVHWKHIWHIFIRRCKIYVTFIHSFIGLYFICQHIYPCIKCVFNVWYSCVKCMHLWMDEFHTIFIINLSHVKFWWFLFVVAFMHHNKNPHCPPMFFPFRGLFH